MNKINLELKHYCSDFNKVRTILKQIGAKKVIVKTQKDYFFNLPQKQEKNSGRFKLRIEKNRKTLVYYERPDFVKGKKTASTVKLYEVKDNELLDLLQKALRIKAVVEKKREVWRKSNAVFHIDAVKGVGGIFEIELQKTGKITDEDKKLFKFYQNKLTPFLGKVIKGSNADLLNKN